MLYGKTRTEARRLLESWRSAIEQEEYYAFGFSKTLYSFLPPWRQNEPDFAFKAVFDNDERLHNLNLLGQPIVSPDKIAGLGGKIVVFSRAYAEIKAQLEGLGLAEGPDFIRWDSFWALVSFFKYRRLHFPAQLTAYITDRCNLSCEHCEVGVPRLKERRDLAPDALAGSLEIFFKSVDSLMRLALMGGETLLHKDLRGILEVAGQYRPRISDMVLVTNGAVMADESLLELLRKYHIRLIISDYSESGITSYQVRLRKTLTFLEEKKWKPILSDEPWWDMRPDENDRLKMAGFTDEDWFGHYAACAPDCPILLGSRLFPCAQALAATGEGLNAMHSEHEGLYTDIGAFETRTDEGRYAAFLNALGFFDGAYPASCRQCRGRNTGLARLAARAKQA